MNHEPSPMVTRLEGLRDAGDRAALARLRRGLGQSYGAVEMYPYVVPFLPSRGRDGRDYFLVASLFGLHPSPSAVPGESIGRVFARLRDQGGAAESTEGRFRALLAAHEDDIGEHLRHAVSLARSHNVGIDYHRLLRDLRLWSHPERFAQLGWARDFWRRSTEAAAEVPSIETSE